MRIPMISLMAAGALALGGCTDMYGYNGLGVGVGYGGGYGGYGGGYGSYGYGSPYGGYYGSSYGYPSYGYGSGYGYGSPYYGWYDNYYYPGTGYLRLRQLSPAALDDPDPEGLLVQAFAHDAPRARRPRHRASSRIGAASKPNPSLGATTVRPHAKRAARPAIDKGPLNSLPAGGGSARSRRRSSPGHRPGW